MCDKSRWVSIITVNYHGWQDTCAMIDSLARHERYPYEVIVVDNASGGEDADRIARLHPEVKLVRSPHNLGFAGGNNLALPWAEGGYLFFLNNDVEIEEPILERLVRRLDTPEAGGVSPKIRFYEAPRQVQYDGFWRLTPITLRNPHHPPSLPAAESYEVDVLHGAAMMVRREVLQHVGPMREDYFLFYEEFDWSYRIREAGYRMWCDPTVVVYHKEGGSIGKISPMRVRYMVRARLLFAHYHCHGWRKPLAYAYQLGPVLLRNVLSYALRGEWSLLKASVQGSFFFCAKKIFFL